MNDPEAPVFAQLRAATQILDFACKGMTMEDFDARLTALEEAKGA